MKTQAQELAHKFDNDGQLFTKDGVNIKDVLKETCKRVIKDPKGGYYRKYVFEDESSIIIFNDCWDIGTSKDDENFSCTAFSE